MLFLTRPMFQLYLLLLAVAANAVEYEMLYPSQLDPLNPDAKLEADLALFLIVGPNISDVILTNETECALHCDSLDWCIAHNFQQFCLHVADRATLKMETFGPDHQFNYDWDMQIDNLMMMDDKVYRHINGKYGVDVAERIDPRRIIGPHNKKVIHPEPTFETFVYTDTHYEPYPTWRNYNRTRGSSTQWFHGYPLKGVKPDAPTCDGGTCHLRASMLETMRLGVHSLNEGGAAILDQVFRREHRYFYIKNHATGQYMNCQNQNDDNTRGCNWEDTPTQKWSFPNSKTRNSAPNGMLQAHDLTTGDHLGFLDVSRCHTEPSHIRILPGGVHGGDEELHCGVGKFFIELGAIRFQNEDGDEILTISNDARLCRGVDCGGNANILFESADTTPSANKFKHIKYENGSYVHCHEEGTLADAEAKTPGKFCSATPNATQMFAVEWNFNTYDQSTVLRTTTDTTRNMCVSVWEINPRSNTWEQVGSLAYFDLGDGGYIPYKHSDWCHPLEEIFDDVLVAKTVFGFEQKLVESTTRFPGLVVVNISSSIIPNSDKNLTAEVTPLYDSNDEFQWVTGESGCPANHYVSRLSADGLTLGCRKVNQFGTLGPSSGFYNVTSGSFEKCPTGEVVIGYNGTMMECAPITISDVDVSEVGPEMPYVGTLSRPTKGVDHNHGPTDNWKGTPISSITASEEEANKLDVFHYGERCYVRIGDASYKDRRNQDVVNRAGLEEAAKCRLENQYVTHVQCLTSNCREGLNITCQAAATCKVDTTTVTKRSYTCIHGEVAVGIECEGPDDTGDPCPVYNMLCAPVTEDATLRPSIGPETDDSDDDGVNVAALVGGVLGFTLFILVFTSLCICFGPDDPSPESRDITQVTSDSIIVGARVNVHRAKKLPVTIKKRTNVEVNYMF